MMMTLLLPLLVTVQEANSQATRGTVASQTSQDQVESDRVDIVVTGERDRRETVDERRTRLAETPYATTMRVPLNSRIARAPGQRDVESIATNQGLAGLLGAGPGMNFEATGGTGLNRRVKKVHVCKASSKYVHEDIACGLIDANTALEAGDFAQARTLLDRLSGFSSLNDTERYFVETHRFMLAQATSDQAAQYVALAAMANSGAMPAGEMASAQQALLTMALKRNDDPAAIVHLAQLASMDVADEQELATLAILYDRTGERDRAIASMRAAIASVRARGGTPPSEWSAFVSAGR